MGATTCILKLDVSSKDHNNILEVTNSYIKFNSASKDHTTTLDAITWSVKLDVSSTAILGVTTSNLKLDLGSKDCSSLITDRSRKIK